MTIDVDVNDRIDTGALASEGMPSLADVAQEAGGAWPAGWYDGEVIEGYNAGGYQFNTEDSLSKNGDSRNLRVALKLTATSDRKDGDGNAVATGATRSTFFSTNYRITDLTAANVARIKDGSADTRLKIALGKLGQIEKAVGMPWIKHPQGHLMPGKLVGQKVSVRLNIGEKGFNEVTAFRARK